MQDRNPGLPARVPDQSGRVQPSERETRLAIAGQRMLQTFLSATDMGRDGGPIQVTRWPYVRYLVYDALQERLGLGESRYRDAHWRNNDGFLTGLQSLAKRISDDIPDEVQTRDDWELVLNAATFLLHQQFDTVNPTLETDPVALQRARDQQIANTSTSAGAFSDRALQEFFDSNRAVVDEHPLPAEAPKMQDPEDERIRQRDLAAVEKMMAKLRLPRRLPEGYELQVIDSARVSHALSGFAQLGIARAGSLPDGVLSISDERKCITLIPIFDEQDNFINVVYSRDPRALQMTPEIEQTLTRLRHDLFYEPEQPQREPTEFERRLNAVMDKQEQQGHVVRRGEDDERKLVVVSATVDNRRVTTVIKTEDIEEEGILVGTIYAVQYREEDEYLTVLRGGTANPSVVRIPLSDTKATRGWQEKRLGNQFFGAGHVLLREQRQQEQQTILGFIEGAQFDPQLTSEWSANFS